MYNNDRWARRPIPMRVGGGGGVGDGAVAGGA